MKKRNATSWEIQNADFAFILCNISWLWLKVSNKQDSTTSFKELLV